MLLPTTEQCIQVAETALGTKLPAEFRNRLLTNNGGELTTAGSDWRVFPVLDTTDGVRKTRTANHMVAETQRAASLPGFPAGAVAVGTNDSGQLLVFLRHGTLPLLQGRLLRWDPISKQCEPTALDYT